MSIDKTQIRKRDQTCKFSVVKITYVFLLDIKKMILAVVHVVLRAGDVNDVLVVGLAAGEANVHLEIVHDFTDLASSLPDYARVDTVIQLNLNRQHVLLINK